MKTKLFSLLAGVALIALAGAANADQLNSGNSLVLTNGQMDGVTAGASSLANALAGAQGDFDASTSTQTNTVSQTSIPSLGQYGFALGQSLATAAAASALFQAAVIVHADSAATLP